MLHQTLVDKLVLDFLAKNSGQGILISCTQTWKAKKLVKEIFEELLRFFRENELFLENSTNWLKIYTKDKFIIASPFLTKLEMDLIIPSKIVVIEKSTLDFDDFSLIQQYSQPIEMY